MAVLKAPRETAMRRPAPGGRLLLAGALLTLTISPASAGEPTTDRFAFTGAYRFADIPGAMPNAMHLPAEAVPIPLPNPGVARDVPLVAVPQAFPETIANRKRAGDAAPGAIVTSAIPETRPASEGGAPEQSPTPSIATVKGEAEDRAPFGTDSRSTLGALNDSQLEDARSTAPAPIVTLPTQATGRTGTTAGPRSEGKDRTAALPEKKPTPAAITRSPAVSRPPSASANDAAKARSRTTRPAAQPRRSAPSVNRSPAPPRRHAGAPGSGAGGSSQPTLLAPTPPWAERAFQRAR